jgi:tetratricopeptide (TPR) repeat protein
VPLRVWCLFALVIFAAAGCGGGPARDALPSTEELLRADSQWSRGEVQETIASLERILEQDSRSFAARYRLGVLKVYAEPRDAIGILEQAASLAPEHPGPRLFTGLARLRLSDFQGADRDLRAALGLARARSGTLPADTSDAVMLGLADLDVDDPNGAVAAFESALAADSTDARLWYQYGRAALRSGLIAPGETAARRAIALDPRLAEAHVLLASALTAEGRDDEARAELEAALAERPALASAHYRRAQLLIKQQELRDASRDLWIAVLEDPTRPEYHYQLGRVMMRMSLPDQGTIHLQQAEALQGFLNRERRR